MKPGIPVIAFLCVAGALCAGAGHENSLVEIISTCQYTHPFLPWQKMSPHTRHGYGIAIGATHILTTENLVRNHTMIEIRRPGSGEKINVRLVLADCQVNLALLSAGRETTPAFDPVPLADRVPAGIDLSIIQTDETGSVQTGKGKVVQTAVQSLPSAPYSILVHTLLTDLNVNGESAPVLLPDGRVAGLTVSYSNNSRTGQMLPCHILKRFVDDVLEPPYTGFASAGFIWAQLVDPAKRKYLNVKSSGRGILALSCVPGAGAAESIEPNDVILEWDGYPVDNMGYYEDPEFGRLSFPYLIKGKRIPGTVVPVRIVRNGTIQETKVRLERLLDEQSLIPENVEHTQPEYLVEGGLIIRELTGRYLRSHGAKWQSNVDSRLVHAYMTRKYAPEKPGDRVLILADVLPDPINVGYQEINNAPITRINGEPVRNIGDVFRIVDRDGHIRRLTLQSMGTDIALDASQLDEANGRIAATYRIPGLSHRHSAAEQ